MALVYSFCWRAGSQTEGHWLHKMCMHTCSERQSESGGRRSHLAGPSPQPNHWGGPTSRCPACPAPCRTLLLSAQATPGRGSRRTIVIIILKKGQQAYNCCHYLEKGAAGVQLFPLSAQATPVRGSRRTIAFIILKTGAVGVRAIVGAVGVQLLPLLAPAVPVQKLCASECARL